MEITAKNVRRRATMKDVAKRAGVSVQTVSNYVNNRSHLMSAATQAKVGEAMAELGYHPNMTARGLRSASTRTLGMMFMDPHAAYLADPLTALLIAGAGDVARERGFGLLIQNTRDYRKRDLGLLAPVLEGRVDGAMLLLTGEAKVRDWYLKQLEDRGVYYVIFDHPLRGGQGCSVRASDRESGREMAEHLIEKGHKRIGFVAAGVPWANVEERHAGYREALEAAGIKPDPKLELFEAGWEPSGGGEMVAKLLDSKKPPTAVMCGSDLLAIGAIREIKRRGMDVPGDIAITGFDDFVFSEYIEPPLTTVRVPAYDMGRQAALILIESLESGKRPSGEMVLPTELRRRRSA